MKYIAVSKDLCTITFFSLLFFKKISQTWGFTTSSNLHANYETMTWCGLVYDDYFSEYKYTLLIINIAL